MLAICNPSRVQPAQIKVRFWYLQNSRQNLWRYWHQNMVQSSSKAWLISLLGLVLISKAICLVPQVKQSSPSRFVKPIGEEEVKLVCLVKDAQAYTWYKNGRKITSLFTRYHVKPYRFLRITDVLKSDSGLFVCVTSNSYGSANCTISFTVEDPTVSPTNITGEKPQFLYPSVMQSAKSEYRVGDKFDLTCEAKGTPSPVVTWYKNGKIYRGGMNTQISAGRYDYKVRFIAVDLVDAGKYVCNVSNAFGFLTYSYKFTVEEKLKSPPQAYRIWEQKKPIYVGQDVELFCTILTNDRNTKYRWYYRDAELPNERNLGVLIDPRLYKQPPYNGASKQLAHVRFTLRLQNLTIDQSGHYGCQAENVVGNNSLVTNLTVTYRHSIPVIPVTTVPKHRNTTQAQGNSSITSAVTEREKTNWMLIGVSAAVIIALIIVTVWFCWKLKKVRTYAGRPSSGIASLQPKYDVHNEYVVVPDFK